MTEEELQEGMKDLKKMVEDGQMSFPSHLMPMVRSSFEAVRKRPDGAVDPDTVNGFIRSTLLAMMAAKQSGALQKP